MRIYDDRGNLVDQEVGEISRGMGVDVSDLFDKLFAEGMTVLEARGLIGYLTTHLDFCATLSIVRHQMETEIEERQNDSSRPNNGVATALTERQH